MASNDHSVWRSHGQEAKIGCPDGQHIPWPGEAIRSFLFPCGPPGVPDHERGPARCNSSGAAVDVCSDAPAWVQWADRVADGGVVYVSRALAVSPRAPCIIAQRVARCDLYNSRNCLPQKKLCREIQ